jgi:hypothetical protein
MVAPATFELVSYALEGREPRVQRILAPLREEPLRVFSIIRTLVPQFLASTVRGILRSMASEMYACRRLGRPRVFPS